MKLEDIENTLPHGFHDALLLKVMIDYTKREAIFSFSICTGDVLSEDKEKRETRREGQLKLRDLVFCVIQAPDPKYPYLGSKHLMVDSGSASSVNLPEVSQLSTLIPDGAFFHWFFVSQWNSFIYVAAMDAQFD